MKRMHVRQEAGFTLLETVIVLGIVGLLTAFIISGSGTNTRNDRFLGELKTFSDNVRQAQTRSYTVQTGKFSSCATTVLAPGGLDRACYWRGTVMGYTTSSAADGTYARSLLYGDDLSAYSGISNQQTAIYGMTADQSFGLSGLKLEGITLTDASGVGTDVSRLSLAFLAPDAKAYSCITGACTPSMVNSSPFTDARKVTFKLTDSVSNLTGLVTFDPASGTISTMVK